MTLTSLSLIEIKQTWFFVPQTLPLINQLNTNMCDNKSLPLSGKKIGKTFADKR